MSGWTKAVLEHISYHKFEHMVSTCKMQQMLAKPGLYHTANSNLSASIGRKGVNSLNLTVNPSSSPLCQIWLGSGYI